MNTEKINLVYIKGKEELCKGKMLEQKGKLDKAVQ